MGSRSRRPARRLFGRAIVVTAVIFVAAAGFNVYVLARAQDASLRQAQADLRDSLAAAQAAAAGDAGQYALAEVMAAHARSEARAAESQLDGDPVAQALRALPFVRDQVAALRNLDGVVERAADAALRGESMVAELDAQRHAPGHGHTIDVAGTYYVKHQAAIEQLAGEVMDLPRQVAATDRAGLLPPLRDAYARLDRPMAQLSAAEPTLRQLLAAAPRLLGRDRPSVYLLLFADNAEIRPGGGFIGTYGLLRFDRGHYVTSVNSTYNLEDPLITQRTFQAGGSHYVTAPLPLALAWSEFRTRTLFLRDSAWSVQWGDNARLAEQLYVAEAGRKKPIDGVLLVDVTTISYLLDVVGPLQVPVSADRGSPMVTVDAANATQTILEYTRNTRDKTFLKRMQDVLTAHLEAMPTSRLGAVAAAFGRAADERHFMLWMNDPAAQSLVNQYHLARPVPPPGGDGIMPVYANLAGTKADLFTDRSTDIHIAANGHHQVTVRLANHAPATLEKDQRHFNELVRFYLPPDATHVRISGLAPRSKLFYGATLGLVDFGSDQGWRVFGGWVWVDGGQTGTLVVDYDRAPPGPNFSFSLVKQPGLTTVAYTVELDAAGLVPVGEGTTGRNTVNWSFNLSQDRELLARQAEPATRG